MSVAEQLLAQARAAHEAFAADVRASCSGQGHEPGCGARALWAVGMSIAALEEYESVLLQADGSSRLTLDIVDVMARWHDKIESQRHRLVEEARALCEVGSSGCTLDSAHE